MRSGLSVTARIALLEYGADTSRWGTDLDMTLLPVYLCTHDSHACSYAPLFQLSWWKRTMIPLAAAARIQSSHFLNLDKRAQCSPSACIFKIFKIGNIFGWLRLPEIYSSQNIFTRKLSERKKATVYVQYFMKLIFKLFKFNAFLILRNCY